MAKKIKRSTNSLHSKFHQTISHSRRFRAEEGEEEFEGAPGPEESEEGPAAPGRGQKGRSRHEAYNIHRADASAASRKQLEEDLAYYKTRSELGIPPGQPGPARAELDREWAPPTVRRQDVDLIRRQQREQSWRTQPSVYRVPPNEKKSVNSFVEEELRRTAPSHYQWFQGKIQDPNSEFNKGLESERAKTGRFTSGQRKRQQIYTDALQQGTTHEEAYDRVRRSVLRERVGRPAERLRATRVSEAREVLAPPRPSGRETKFSSVAPTQTGFKFGISAQRRPSLDELKQKFPGRPEGDLLQIQQASGELISQELLANQKWAHETRRANLLGQQKGRIKENPDKVTIFTTNIGHPAVSVPSDSLIGQYIIRKRKSVLGGYGVGSPQLRGQFPAAVRDAHIIDVATGAALGIQGRQGIFNTTGYRVAGKQSPGYGRPKPLGAHILYDTSTGRPLYDQQGNIRYSEGATRPVDWRTPDVGFRILMG